VALVKSRRAHEYAPRTCGTRSLRASPMNSLRESLFCLDEIKHRALARSRDPSAYYSKEKFRKSDISSRFLPSSEDNSRFIPLCSQRKLRDIIFFIFEVVAKAINAYGNARCGRVFRYANSRPRDHRFFPSPPGTRRSSRVLTLNSARERRMAEVIIGAYAAYVSRFVELIKPRPTNLPHFPPSSIRFIALLATLNVFLSNLNNKRSC